MNPRCISILLKILLTIILVARAQVIIYLLTLHVWISQKMKQINSILVVKTIMSMDAVYILATNNTSLRPWHLIKHLLLRFTCILVPRKVRRIVTSVIYYCLHPWIGLSNYGTPKLKKSLYLLLKVLKNMCMMFNGVQRIQVCLLHVMEMVTLISGISTRIQKHQ